MYLDYRRCHICYLIVVSSSSFGLIRKKMLWYGQFFTPVDIIATAVKKILELLTRTSHSE